MLLSTGRSKEWIKDLKLDKRLTVRPVSGSQVFDVTGLRAAFVEGVLIDTRSRVDRNDRRPALGLPRAADRGPLELPQGGGLRPPRRSLNRDHEADVARARRGARRAAQLALGAHRTDFA